MKDLLVCGDERVERAIDAYFEPRPSSTGTSNHTATQAEAKGAEAGDEAPLQSKKDITQRRACWWGGSGEGVQCGRMGCGSDGLCVCV